MVPTYTRDLVERLLWVLATGADGIVHIVNGGVCSWWEFAIATLELAGFPQEIEPVEAFAFPTAARRPRLSALESSRVRALGLGEPRHWRDALAAYLVEIGVVGR